jgi:Carboxypeptidase regulatory-like domain
MRTKLFATVVFLSGLPLLAQTFGEITGRVSDASGAGVPDSTITLTNTSTNAVRQSQSGSDGIYSFPSLAPGVYNVRTEHAGFKSAMSNNVEVQVQQSVRLDLTLEVGQTSESIEVSAAADLLQSENATVGTVVETKSITELPLNGRQYLNLVTLAPNVSNLAPPSGQAQSRQGGDRSDQSISAGGNRIVFDYFTLDGVVNTDPNFNTYIVLPSIDALQEFKVQTGVYPAEFGHEATQINVLTKSGGNNYHGSLFEFVRNNDFDALPYQFTAQKPGVSPFKWNDYGFEVDGPVRIPRLFNGRNKLFFMANYEWLRQRQTQQAIYNVPTAAMFGGDFRSTPTIQQPTIYDPTTQMPFPNNVIPSNRISPISQALLKYYNPATFPDRLTSNYVQNNGSPKNRDGFVLRMDFVESAKSQWSGRYSWGDENFVNQTINVSGSKLLTNYEQYMGSNTRILSANVVNEARFGYARFYNSLSTVSAFITDITASLNLPNLPTSGPPVTWGIPSVALTGYSGFGDNSDGPYQNQNNTAQFIDTVSWIKGKHAFKFGFEYDRQNFDQVGNQYPRGQYSFQPNATRSATNTGGDAFAEFLLGDIFSSIVAVSVASAQFQRNVEAAFIDDTWKITPKFTLSLGLRYELTPPYTDLMNNLFIVHVPHIYETPGAPQSDWPYFLRQGSCTDPYNANPPIRIRWVVTPAQCSNGLLPNQLMNTRYTDFAPRFAIAYSPDSKTVIRTGFGIFFSQDNSNSVFFDLARNLAVRNTNYATTGNADLTYSNAFPSTAGSTVPIPTGPYAYSDNPNHHTATTMQYLFNIQRQFGSSWAVEAGYLGSLSHHLYGFWNQNEGIPSNDGKSAASHLPFGDYGFIQSVEDMGNGEYNSLALKVSKRFSGGLSLITAYTHSISIDDTSNIRIQGYDTLFPQNSYCIRCERGLSSFDTRNRLVVSPLYELPVGKGKPLTINNSVANAIVGGWQVGGIFTLQSGLPEVITIGGIDRSVTQSGYDRPNATGIGSSISNPTPNGWYNRDAFVEEPVGQFGNVGRDTAISPGIFAINAEVHKNFRIPYKEGHQVQFRAEAFNLLNHPNWGQPQMNILAGAATPGQPATYPHQGFGTISSLAGTQGGASGVAMRQLQLGLKYTF